MLSLNKPKHPIDTYSNIFRLGSHSRKLFVGCGRSIQNEMRANVQKTRDNDTVYIMTLQQTVSFIHDEGQALFLTHINNISTIVVYFQAHHHITAT